MDAPGLKARVGSGVLLAGALILFFVLGAVGSYEPVAGLVLAAGLAFVVAFYARPQWFVYACIFVLCFAGLLHLPVTSDGFSSAVALALPALGLQLAGSLVGKDRHLARVFAGRFDLLLPLVFMLVMFISVKNSREIGPAIRQIQQFFYVVGIYALVLLVIRDKRTLRLALLAFLIGGFLVEVIGLVEGLARVTVYDLTGDRSLLGADLSESFLQVEEAGRINGPLGDAPFHGIFVTVTAALSAWFFFTTTRKAARAFCVLVFVLAIYNVVGTGSRGAFLSLAIALAVFWALAEIPNKAAFALLGGALFAVVTGALVLVASAQGESARALTYNDDTSETAEMRIKNLPVALRMFADYPVFGIGPDGFIANFGRYATNLSNLSSREKALKTHNTPVQIMAENGLVGLAVFFAAVGSAVARTWAAARRAPARDDRILGAALLAALAAYGLFMLTSNSLLDKYLWLLLALMQAHYSITFDKPAQGDA